MAKNWWKNKNLNFFLITDIPPSAFPPSKNFAIIPIHVPLLKNFIDTLSKSPIWKFILHPCPYPPATETCKFHSWFLKISLRDSTLNIWIPPHPPKNFWMAPPHWKISMTTWSWHHLASYFPRTKMANLDGMARCSNLTKTTFKKKSTWTQQN